MTRSNPDEREPPEPGPRRWEVVLDPEFIEHLVYWISTDRRVALRLADFLRTIPRDPFQGIGKPEPLRNRGSNTWSRRLTDEHRVVYRVEGSTIRFLQARHHY